MAVIATPYAGNTSWPSDWQGSRLTGHYEDILGNPVKGKIVFKPTPLAILSKATKTIILPAAREVTLDSEGRFDIILPATDDPDTNPTGFTYLVTELVPGGRSFSIAAPQNATQDMVDIAPLPSADGNAIVRGPEGASAYDLAVLHGFVGSEADWLNSLKGADGIVLDDGTGGGTPANLATVATTGSYADLAGKPVLAEVATTGSYAALTGRPNFASVAVSGRYDDLTGKPAFDDLAQAVQAKAPLVAPQWTANTTYQAGQAVVAPDGTTVYMLATGSSGSTYTAAQFKRPPASLAAPSVAPARTTLAVQEQVTGNVNWYDLQDIRTPDFVDVASFGGRGDGAIGATSGTAGTVNDKAFSDCIAWCKNFGKGMYISAGVYSTTQTVDARNISVMGPRSSSGVDGAVIQQLNTAGVPTRTVMIVGGANKVVENLYLAHHTTPAVSVSDIDGAGLRFIQAGPQFLLSNIFTYKTTYGFYCLESMDTTVTSGAASRNFMYSCFVHTLRSLEFSRGAGWFGSWRAGNTGSVFLNLYASNTGTGNALATPGFTASNAYWIFGGGTEGMTDELYVNQVNVEWGKSKYAIKLMGVTHADISNIHLEGWVPTANTGETAAVVYATPDSNTKAISVHGLFWKSGIFDTTFLPAGADLALVHVARPTSIDFGPITFTNLQSPTGVPTFRRHRFGKDSSGSSSGSVVTYRGSIMGNSAPATISPDTIDSGVVNVSSVDLANPVVSANPTLAPPSGISASTTGGNTTLSWLGVAGALSYAIHRKARVGGNYALIGYTSTTTYTDLDVGTSPDFVYRVASLPWVESDGSDEVRSNGSPNDGSDSTVFSYPVGSFATAAAGEWNQFGPTDSTVVSGTPGIVVETGGILHARTGATAGLASGADSMTLRLVKSGWTDWKNWTWEADVSADTLRAALTVLLSARTTATVPSYAFAKITTNGIRLAYKTSTSGSALTTATLVSGGSADLSSVTPAIDSTWNRVKIDYSVQSDGSALLTYSIGGVVKAQALIPTTVAAVIPSGWVEMKFEDQGSVADNYGIRIRESSTGTGLFTLKHGVV